MFVLPGPRRRRLGRLALDLPGGARACARSASTRTIALRAKSLDRARAAYDDADDVFVPYRDDGELDAHHRQADVIAATHFKSAVLVAELQARRDDFLPAYYVQDYEPFFTSRDSADVAGGDRELHADPRVPAVRQDPLAVQHRQPRATACSWPRSSPASTSTSTARAERAAPADRCGSAPWSARAPRAASPVPRSRCSSSSASSAAATSRSRRSAAPRPTSSG